MQTPTSGPTGQAHKVVDRKKKYKRVRAFTPDDRAAHRVIEKQRREALNQKFLDLARLLPGLAHSRRLSKSLIVNESISYLKTQREVRLAAAREIRELLADYDKALLELKNWQTSSNPVINEQQQYQPERKALMELLKVDQEEFGTFLGGFGDNGPNDEHDEDHGGEESGDRIPEENTARHSDTEDISENNMHSVPSMTGHVDILPPVIEQGEIQPDHMPHTDLFDFRPIQPQPASPELSLPAGSVVNSNQSFDFGLDHDFNVGWVNDSENQMLNETISATGFNNFPNQDLYSIPLPPHIYQTSSPLIQQSYDLYGQQRMQSQEQL